MVLQDRHVLVGRGVEDHLRAGARGTPRASAPDRGRPPGPTSSATASSVTSRSCRWVSSLSRSVRRRRLEVADLPRDLGADGPSGARDQHAPAAQELTHGREVGLDLPPAQEVLDPQVAQVAGGDARRRRSRGPTAAPGATRRPPRTASRRRGSGRSWRSGSPAAPGRRASCPDERRDRGAPAQHARRRGAPARGAADRRRPARRHGDRSRGGAGCRSSTWAPASPAPISEHPRRVRPSTARRRKREEAALEPDRAERHHRGGAPEHDHGERDRPGRRGRRA